MFVDLSNQLQFGDYSQRSGKTEKDKWRLLYDWQRIDFRKCDHIEKNMFTLTLFYFSTSIKGPGRTSSTYNIVKPYSLAARAVLVYEIPAIIQLSIDKKNKDCQEYVYFGVILSLMLIKIQEFSFSSRRLCQR